MTIREATVNDIAQMQFVRNAVTENILSDPSLVSYADYEKLLNATGKGWVYEIEKRIAGFAIVDLTGHNIWALFLLPGHERKGIGRQLHDTMLNWYFSQTRETVWLSTSPGTRAETFYRQAGWKYIGQHGKGELKLEMDYTNWMED